MQIIANSFFKSSMKSGNNTTERKLETLEAKLEALDARFEENSKKLDKLFELFEGKNYPQKRNETMPWISSNSTVVWDFLMETNM